MTGILGGLIGSLRSLRITFVGSTAANSPTVSFPAGTAAGDIAILSNNGGISFGSPTPVPPAPTGWTQVHGVGGVQFITSSHSYKLLNSSDVSGGSITIGTSYPTTNRKLLLVFRPSSPVLTLTVVSPNAQATTGVPTNQTLSISTATSPVISFVTYYSSQAVTLRGSSVTMNEILGSGTVHYVKYLINNSSPANIVLSMNDTGSNILMSFGLVVT
jgi:hypothetical protein